MFGRRRLGSLSVEMESYDLPLAFNVVLRDEPSVLPPCKSASSEPHPTSTRPSLLRLAGRSGSSASSTSSSEALLSRSSPSSGSSPHCGTTHQNTAELKSYLIVTVNTVVQTWILIERPSPQDHSKVHCELVLTLRGRTLSKPGASPTKQGVGFRETGGAFGISTPDLQDVAAELGHDA